MQGKYRTLGLWTTNVLKNPILLTSIEVVSPAGAKIAAYSDYGSRKFAETPSAVVALNRPILGNYFDNTLYVALNLPKTPNDQGEFLELRVNFEETTSPLRPFFQVVRTYIPAGTEKQAGRTVFPFFEVARSPPTLYRPQKTIKTGCLTSGYFRATAAVPSI